MGLELFSDGGCIRKNPSPYGGTWAWVLVDTGRIIRKASGLILPADVDKQTISNNFSELYAAVRGLESMGIGWNGTWWTDSLITLRRLTGGRKFNGIPAWLVRRAKIVSTGRKWKGMLCAGHPTRKELLTGKAKRNGNPVSVWNIYVDKLCGQAAENFLKRQKSQ